MDQIKFCYRFFIGGTGDKFRKEDPKEEEKRLLTYQLSAEIPIHLRSVENERK
jgi:hypothetical protein